MPNKNLGKGVEKQNHQIQKGCPNQNSNTRRRKKGLPGRVPFRTETILQRNASLQGEITNLKRTRDRIRMNTKLRAKRNAQKRAPHYPCVWFSTFGPQRDPLLFSPPSSRFLSKRLSPNFSFSLVTAFFLLLSLFILIYLGVNFFFPFKLEFLSLPLFLGGSLCFLGVLGLTCGRLPWRRPQVFNQDRVFGRPSSRLRTAS